MEIGFPASRADTAISKIVRDIGMDSDSPILAVLARTVESDIDTATEALEGVRHGRIHIFTATSNLHMRVKFGRDGERLEATRDRVLTMIVDGVVQAKSAGHEVQWSAEDATNSDPKFLLTACRIAIKAGATVINRLVRN